jgi:hypothetical protein
MRTAPAGGAGTGCTPHATTGCRFRRAGSVHRPLGAAPQAPPDEATESRKWTADTVASGCYTEAMAKIVGFHGIAQQYEGGPARSQEWLLAIRGGLEAAGYRAAADSLTTDDVRVAFFGELFRPPGTMAGDLPPYSERDIRPGLEQDLLATLYAQAVAIDPTLGPPTGAMGPGLAAVQVMLDRLLHSRTFAGVAKRLLVGNLKQVTAYFQDGDLRERVLSHVTTEITDDTRIAVGHSLGSVVAYEYLCQHRPKNVGLLVTLGCPLGIPRVIFDRLTPRPTGGTGAWPGRIIRWVNVADTDDVVALRKRLANQFAPLSSGTHVEDRLVDNGDRPHDVGRYLNSRQTGEAIGAFLAIP